MEPFSFCSISRVVVSKFINPTRTRPKFSSCAAFDESYGGNRRDIGYIFTLLSHSTQPLKIKCTYHPILRLVCDLSYEYTFFLFGSFLIHMNKPENLCMGFFI